jgi:signal transduction histidine kinase
MRLRGRLPLFFLIVVLLGSIMSLVLVRLTTENVFRSFVFSGDAAKARTYAAILADYYAENRDWKKVQAFLSEIPEQVFLALDKRIHGERGATSIASFPFETISTLMADRIVLADAEGVIVADSSGMLLGSVHPARHLAHGFPIMVNFAREGTVLVGSMIDSSLTGMDERFLASITGTLLWASLAASLVAILLGLAFAASVTGPLAVLSAAARRVTAGDLSTPVDVSGRDEISELSVSFNAMIRELTRLEEAKKRIIADAAHELRTPVSLIQGTVEAMIDGVYPLDVATLESVHEETLRLSRLIDTLRELEIIESGELKLELEEVDPTEIAEKAVSLFSSQAAGKGIRLSVEEPKTKPPRLLADYVRLGEVVYNLVSNAIKHSSPGSLVRIGVSEETGAAGERRMVRIAVEDSGPGIPIEERQRIFERFYRIDRSRSQDGGGRGLGLAIAAEIAKAHGGGIEVGDSELGGAAFIVSLPAFEPRDP